VSGWPPGRSVSLFIAGWILLQLALPLSYYLGDDPYDERFAWRMYSDVRAVRCKLEFTADGEVVDLNRRYQVAWNRLAKRGRPSILEGMSRDLCQSHDRVELQLLCKHADGEVRTVHEGGVDLCEEAAP
jgi:hypothetical protein